VGDQSSVVCFVAEDSFLRRGGKRSVKNGLVEPDVFKPRANEATLSFTHQDKSLETDKALDEYQRYNALLSGDLPAICRLTFYDLTEGVEPSLPPRFEHDPDDALYGHLHCVTELPLNEDHRRQLAKLATDNRIVREFVKAKLAGPKPM